MEPVIGLAVGRGTGPELAAVFERVVDAIGRAYSAGIDVVRSPRTYHSYFSLKPEGGVERIRELTRQDAEHYEAFCRERADGGTTAIFRTAINAQSLYLVRQHLQAVKVDVISTPTASLLMIRDEAQGFYTGENSHAPGVVTRTMEFSREITHKVISYALRRARREWPDGEVDQVVMAYKFHLLDGALDEWVTEASARHGVEILLLQPDTVNRNLVEHGLSPRTVIIAGNEWADIMHVVLLDRFGSERQESRFTENVHLHPDVAGLVEYQTVHGSADDIAGQDVVNPVATVRAAAAIAERHIGCVGAITAVERGAGGHRQARCPHPGPRRAVRDHGGGRRAAGRAGAPRAPDQSGGRVVTPRTGTALVVVDVQNDFCTGPVATSRYRGSPTTLDAVTTSTARAVDVARNRGTEVVFVRYLGDVEHQGPSWRRRDHVLGKRPKCREGTWGAEFHKVSPAPGEQVFTKRVCFDAFLSEGFEEHLVRNDIGHLVFAGLFTDVCVDSTARTAFQKGFHITVLTDCTASLHLPDEEILRFMSVVYGARTTTHDAPYTWSPGRGEEHPWSAPAWRTASA